MRQKYAVERVLDYFPSLKPEYVAQQLRYNTFVSLANRYFYFEVPKAATTWMKELLRTVEKAPPIKLYTRGDWETRRDMFIHARANMPLPSLVDLDSRTQREVLESPHFLRMTVVRNPYTRLLSVWRNKIVLCEPSAKDVYLQVKGCLPDFYEKTLVSFNEFVHYVAETADLRTCDAHWRRQVDHTFFPALNFSAVIKVEELKLGLQRLEEHLGFSGWAVANERNVSIPIASAAYTRELADKVYSSYQADFEALRYDRNSWPTGGHIPSKEPAENTAWKEKLLDEIIERNLIILDLYEERSRLRTQLRRVSRLHLLAVVNGLAAFHRTLGKTARHLRRWGAGMPRPQWLRDSLSDR